MIGSSLPRQALALTIEWAMEHRTKLMEDWTLCQSRQHPKRIKALLVLADYHLAVTFMDGTQGIADFSAILMAGECGIFEVLKAKAFFDQARLNLGAVTSPNGADIDPAWMYEKIRTTQLWSVPF